MGHDDSAITPVDKVRFDACITVRRLGLAEGGIAYQELPGGLYAITTYIGPYGRILEQAYGELYQRIFALSQYDIFGIPVIEIYRTTRIKPDYALNHTDLYIPVARKA